MTAFYNEPRYYDIAFSWDISHELDLLEAVFARHAQIKVSSVVDLACGTGRFTLGLAKRGLETSGVDISREMLSYAFDRGKDQGILVELFLKDISEFQLYRKFDAAICMTGSFAYLHPDRVVQSHLARVAEHLRKGGVYVIDAGVVTGESGELPPAQEWQQSRDRIRVSARWELVGEQSPTGLVTEVLTLTGDERGWQRSWQQESQVRLYRPQELRQALEASGQFKMVASYRGFDLERPYLNASGEVHEDHASEPNHRMLVVLVKVAADPPPRPQAQFDQRDRRDRYPQRGRDGSRGSRAGGPVRSKPKDRATVAPERKQADRTQADRAQAEPTAAMPRAASDVAAPAGALKRRRRRRGKKPSVQPAEAQ